MDELTALPLVVMAFGLAATVWLWRDAPRREALLGERPSGALPDTRIALVGAVGLWLAASVLVVTFTSGLSTVGRAVAVQLAHGLVALAVLRAARAGPRSTLPATRRVAAGLLVGLAAYGVVAALSIALLLAYQAAGREPPGQDVVEALRASGGVDRLLLIAAAVLVAPAAEEVFYRGILLPALAQAMPLSTALFLQAALFGFVHFWAVPAAWPLAVPIAVVGWAAGRLFVRTGSLLAAVLLHAAFNALQIGMLFAGGG